jgi:hypothetical protein
MGPDQSKANAAAAAAGPPSTAAQSRSPTPEAEAPASENQPQEFEGIPVVSPLINRRVSPPKLPPDIQISPGNIEATTRQIQTYFQEISGTVTKNEDQLTAAIRKQLDEYVKLAPLLEGRKNQLQERLAKMLTLFRTFDSEVKTAVDSLNAEIEKADRLAAEIDPAMPKYADFRKPKPA